MKTLTYTVLNKLDILHDELLAAIPSLGPIPTAGGGREAIMALHGNDQEITLWVPDNADEAAIAAVVEAHDPSLILPDPATQRRDRVTQLLTIGRSGWTDAQRAELLELLAQEITP